MREQENILKKLTLTHCDYEWDVVYCYHYMQLYGLGGIPRNENDAWKALEEIRHRKELSSRTRKAYKELFCEHTLDLLEKLLKQSYSPNYNSVKRCLRSLEIASENGLLLASLALCSFYLNYSVTSTETRRDSEIDEVEVLSKTTHMFDQEAGTYVGKVQFQLDDSPKGEREKRYLEELLRSRTQIEELKPGLFQMLVKYYLVNYSFDRNRKSQNLE